LKIFGIEISRAKKESQQLQLFKDEIPEVKATLPPEMLKPALVKPVKDPTLYYRQMRIEGRGSFAASEYDLAEIGRIEDTDSYVRQAFDKKVALMFKEGWDLVGKNTKTVRYIKARLDQIARASNMPTQIMFRYLGSGLIRRSNSFLVKVRNIESSGGKIRTPPGAKKKLKPVAGYFVLPAEAMEYKLDGNKIVVWRQKMPDGQYVEHNPEDIVHFKYDCKEGFIFGTPTLVPVIDDIRALRKIEENIELLVYQHLFPLFQYKVGTKEAPAGMTEDGQREIEVVKKEIQFMPSEGGIVTPERHEIIPIGAEGRALRAEGYLEHFKKRVFSGLGVSAVDMGEGETANRATADNMSRNMVDSVKDLQQVMETLVTELIFHELLLESTFGDDVLDDENHVHLRFKEIDLDAQIKIANHYADLFTKNVLTFDEARRLGPQLEPIRMPSPDEFDSGKDLSAEYPEWHRTHWKLFEEPKLLIQAIDEPYSPTAKAIARANSLSVSQGDLDESQEGADEQAKKEADTQIAVAKAKAKAKPKPKSAATYNKRAQKKVKNGYLGSTFTGMIHDVIVKVDKEEKLDHDWVGQLIRSEMQTTVKRLIADQVLEFRKGYVSVAHPGDAALVDIIAKSREKFSDRAERYVNRLTNHVVSALKRKVPESMDTKTELISQTRAVMESFKYRTDFIEDVETGKAYQWGRLQAWKDLGVTELFSKAGNEGTCDTCKEHNASITVPQYLTLDDIPPFHANCNCALGVEKATTEQHDEVEDEDDGIQDDGGAGFNSPAPPTTGLPANAPPPLPPVVSPCPNCNQKTRKKKGKCCKCGHKHKDEDAPGNGSGPNGKYSSPRVSEGSDSDAPKASTINVTKCPECGRTAKRKRGDTFHCTSCKHTFTHTMKSKKKDETDVPSTATVKGDADKALPGTGNIAECPKCGKSAIEKKDMPGYYVCRYCKVTFQKVKDVPQDPPQPQDVAKNIKTPTNSKNYAKETKYQNCIMKMEAQIRSRNPNWKEIQVHEMAMAACMHYREENQKENEIEDGEKVESCIKQVKAQLKEKHPDWNDKDITSSAWAICNASLKKGK
jgi:hypothetical protein